MIAHERVGEPGGREARLVLFLHGIFGRGRNWASFARRLVSAGRGWGAVLVDLRLHGESVGVSPPHTLRACAGDVLELAASLEAEEVVLLGHSFGGNVGLLAAGERPRGLRQVWLVDSTPAPGVGSGEATHMLQALRALPDAFPDRRSAVDAVAARGFARPVAEWMATNLESRGGSLVWRLDLDAMEDLLLDFQRTDLWPLVDRPPPGISLHVVKAERSDVLTEAACARIEASAAAGASVRLHRLSGGHWVNVENPNGLLRLLLEHLP